MRERGGQDKSAQEKWQVQDVLGTCLWSFPKCFVAWGEKHQCKKGENVPKFPFLVVWSEKCVSRVNF